MPGLGLCKTPFSSILWLLLRFLPKWGSEEGAEVRREEESALSFEKEASLWHMQLG